MVDSDICCGFIKDMDNCKLQLQTELSRQFNYSLLDYHPLYRILHEHRRYSDATKNFENATIFLCFACRNCAVYRELHLLRQQSPNQ